MLFMQTAARIKVTAGHVLIKNSVLICNPAAEFKFGGRIKSGFTQ